ncbi:MAG: response regulator transcription factor [Candidatus Sulfotelmatobacter sp.]|jgi:DNA-binding response OmpR family regulator
MSETIFVVDGELESRRLARQCLEEAGYAVRTFSTVVSIDEALYGRPSLMLIAATLPDRSGLELCRQIRRNPVQAGIPVILLTVGSSEEQSCAALEAGADNYVAKPFSARELIARVQAALRRGAPPFSVPQADMVIDHGAMQLLVRGQEVAITTLEFRLLDYLARHRGHALTRDVLLDGVWGEMQFVTPRSVDACIRRLREKIEPDIASPTYIKTVRGIGYRFEAAAVWPTSAEDCNCIACTPPNANADANGRGAETRSLRLVKEEAAS